MKKSNKIGALYEKVPREVVDKFRPKTKKKERISLEEFSDRLTSLAGIPSAGPVGGNTMTWTGSSLNSIYGGCGGGGGGAEPTRINGICAAEGNPSEQPNFAYTTLTTDHIDPNWMDHVPF